MKVLTKVVCLLFFLLFVSLLSATTFTSSQDGLWSAVATWGGGGAPITNDDVIINHHITLDETYDPPGLASLTVSGGSLTESSSPCIYSIVIKNNNNLTVTDGTIHIYSIELKGSTSTTTIDANSSITTDANYTNEGTMTLEGTLVVGGDFLNNGTVTGTIDGNGSVTAGSFSGTGTTFGTDQSTIPDGSTVYDDGTLPVILSSFYAYYTNETLTINWATESEENNFGWNIYRGTFEEALQNDMIIKVNSQIIEGAGTTAILTEYEYVDEHDVIAGSSYWYWLEDISSDGETEIHGPTTISVSWGDMPDVPEIYGLSQNYPNPFNPSTSISFALEENSDVKLIIFNIKGEMIKIVFNDYIEADQIITAIWNGDDKNGKEVSSGLYFCKLITHKKVYIKRMLLVK